MKSKKKTCKMGIGSSKDETKTNIEEELAELFLLAIGSFGAMLFVVSFGYLAYAALISFLR